jgi:hypothetical protein
MAWSESPDTAEAIIGKRMRQQGKLDTKYMSELTAFQARQAQIAAARDANTRQLQQPNTYTPGSVGGAGAARPGQKYFRTPNGWVQNWRPNEKGWQFLQRLGQKGFGLRNDPGNSQTTGGRHAAGSPHYSGLAIDFGDARNSRQQLDTYAEWMRKHQQALGLSRVLWQTKDHFNHVDVAINPR